MWGTNPWKRVEILSEIWNETKRRAFGKETWYWSMTRQGLIHDLMLHQNNFITQCTAKGDSKIS